MSEDGRAVLPGSNGIGEVQCRGPTVFQGYWQDPAATAAAFQDGWFCTGEPGLLDLLIYSMHLGAAHGHSLQNFQTSPTSLLHLTCLVFLLFGWFGFDGAAIGSLPACKGQLSFVAMCCIFAVPAL